MNFDSQFSIEDIGLSADEVFNGLLNHGLFAEKLPPCFFSDGLAGITDPEIRATLDADTDKKLAKAIGQCSHDYIRYAALRDTNVPRHLGVPHPESYFVQALAIKKHWNLIKEQCLQPYPNVSRIYVRHTKGGHIFEMSYKGSERFEHEETELEWQAGRTKGVWPCFVGYLVELIGEKGRGKRGRGARDIDRLFMTAYA